MKIYKDLIIKGSEEALKKFKDSLSLNIFPSWECIVENKNMPQYIGICYKGKDFPMSGLTILKTDSQYEVANIVPLTQNQLSYDEYNGILQLFYDDFLKNYNQSDISVSYNESDEITEKDILKEETVSALKTFSNCANKSTGSIHPLDKKRWFDFICAAYKNGDWRELSEWYLESFLIEDYGWSPEWASKLASEYNFGIRLLNHWERY